MALNISTTACPDMPADVSTIFKELILGKSKRDNEIRQTKDTAAAAAQSKKQRMQKSMSGCMDLSSSANCDEKIANFIYLSQ